jgi:starvation-inducible DNA-binding protein
MALRTGAPTGTISSNAISIEAAGKADLAASFAGVGLAEKLLLLNQEDSMPGTRTLARDVSQENREDHPVVQHLQRQVANAFVLYANYKHYHWQTYGPLFRDLHKMFDGFAKDVLGTIDELAERIRMIGPDVKHVQLKEMQEGANVHSSVAEQTMREMAEEADANLMIVIKDMRDAARAADDNNDPGTVDLFSKIVQIHERHEWFLREVLKKKDGLVT